MVGQALQFSGEHIWSQDDNLNGSVIVSSGAILTIQSNLTVSEGSQIVIEEGGTINLDEGEIDCRK